MRCLTLLFVLVALACSGADDDGEFCRVDGDCADLCNRLGECMQAEDAIEIRVSWTFAGQAPSTTDPSACGSVSDFELRLETPSSREEIAYYPIPCENGTVFYDRMPSRITGVTLVGRDAAGNDLSSATMELPAGGGNLDFAF